MDKSGDRIRTMFDSIAPRYAITNRVISLGNVDRVLKRMISAARLSGGERLLDVATGTGDVIARALSSHPSIEAVGVDFSHEMLARAKRRDALRAVTFVQSDAMNLPFADGSFDVVTSAYLIRNVVSVEDCFLEQHRVLRSGGRVVCVDTCPPRGVLAPLAASYLRVGVPLIGRLITHAQDAYQYLPASTRAFKQPSQVATIMERVGFVNIRYRMMVAGTIALYTARRAR